jgi:hypothetical protein
MRCGPTVPGTSMLIKHKPTDDARRTLSAGGWSRVRSLCLQGLDTGACDFVPTPYAMLAPITSNVPFADLTLHAWAYTGLSYDGLRSVVFPRPFEHHIQYRFLPVHPPSTLQLVHGLAQQQHDLVTHAPLATPNGRSRRVYLLPNTTMQPNGRRLIHQFYDYNTIRQLRHARSPHTQNPISAANIYRHPTP